MIIPDQKKTVSVILSKLRPEGGTESAPVRNEREMGEPSPLKMIAEDMMLAFKNGSVSDLETALEAFKGVIATEDEIEDHEEEEHE